MRLLVGYHSYCFLFLHFLYIKIAIQYVPKQKKYSPYKGEISPEVPNLLQRNFHAEGLNQKWITDITEFHMPAGKVYLSSLLCPFAAEPA